MGTTLNCVLEGSLQRKINLLVWCHSKKLYAVAVHPNDMAFITAGHDRVVAKWRKQKVLWKLTIQTEAVCASYHPSSATVAIGTIDGHAIILNAESGAHIW